jgi:hypothetical protein
MKESLSGLAVSIGEDSPRRLSKDAMRSTKWERVSTSSVEEDSEDEAMF